MKYVCIDCLKSNPLKSYAVTNGSINKCNYCLGTNSCLDTEEAFRLITDRVKNTIIPLEELNSYFQAMFWEGADIVDTFDLSSFVTDIIEIENEDFSEELIDYLYSEIGTENDIFVIDDGTLENNIYDEKWEDFIESSLHSYRFFNDRARSFLDSVFETIHVNEKLKNELLELITSDTSIFRARIANSKHERERIISNPSSELGPVPKKLAGSQRMTPYGIPAFYASLDRETCFSEIRSITGDFVISAEFRPANEIRLLNLKKLKQISKENIELLTENYRDCKKSHMIFIS